MTHPHLSCDAFQDLLPAYLERDLEVPAAADAELHLAACTACRSLVADLNRITTEAKALPLLSPSRDLWPGIEARVNTVVTVLPVARVQSRWQLGAIAAGLVAVTALSTWQLARRTDPETPVVASAPAIVSAPAAVATPTPSAPAVVPVAVVERAPRPAAQVTYATEIGKLQALLQARANDLDPATVAVIESSIATIDSAIVEAKAALDRDPVSRFLESQLNKSLERKLGLLRKAALLASST
jgi:predicted anti-sigma-YlaC factor YlaD